MEATKGAAVRAGEAGGAEHLKQVYKGNCCGVSSGSVGTLW